MELTGNVFRRGAAGYEEARKSTVWNARVPNRFPDVIVQACSVADVQNAVRFAKRHGLRVGIRSGGHSWTASHLRHGGLLLDVSRLDRIAVDGEAMTAAVGPGKHGNEMCAVLAAEDLFFPAGHCKGVAVGGYLLQGGYGWNSRVLGPACESVLAVDVVNADGELIHANSEENSDIFWAARGSGPGFFGVVVQFHVRIYHKPAVCGSSVYAYPLDLLEDIYRWAHAIGPEVDRRVELQVLMCTNFEPLGIDQPTIVIAAPVFADSEDEAREAVRLLDTCPVREQALAAIPFAPMTLLDWYDAVMHAYPDEHRYAADNMWTSASIEDLLPALKSIAQTLPPAPSHCLWLNWGPAPKRQDMAYSMEDDTYIALYSVWQDALDDEHYGDWARYHMAEMAPLATGIQLADENLGQRPAQFASKTAMSRLDLVRATYDPEGRFHSWMGRP
ncbi:FAD-binding oxidoreductase [Streptomyces sp. NPDC127084]|uniref:FAD-binding oxidoreductase n=1 Tax=Streptomyces sp. NPDC127084 TaxID=3347133 RepID=UPI00364916D4